MSTTLETFDTKLSEYLSKQVCPICFECVNNKDAILFPCGHVTHNQCIELALKTVYIDVKEYVNPTYSLINLGKQCSFCRKDCDSEKHSEKPITIGIINKIKNDKRRKETMKKVSSIIHKG